MTTYHPTRTSIKTGEGGVYPFWQQYNLIMKQLNSKEVEEYLLNSDLRLYTMILNYIEKIQTTDEFQRIDLLVNTLQMIQGNIERGLKNQKKSEMFKKQKNNLWKDV